MRHRASLARTASRALVVALCFATTSASAPAAVIDRIAVVVNDDVITLSEVYDMGAEYIEAAATAGGPGSRRSAELEVLDVLVQRMLISQEITRLGLDVTEVELDRAVDDVARRNGLDRENLRTEVEVSGITWEDYRKELRENLRQMKFTQTVIRPRIAVNDDELQDAYRRLVKSADLPTVAELGALFLSFPADADDDAKAAVVDQAREALKRIRAGEDFGAVAAELDQGPYGEQGGHMGTYRKGELVGALDSVAFALDEGQTSEPVVAAQGVFLLHVFSLETEDVPAFEDVRNKLFEQVYSDRIDDETEQWELQARRRSSVLVKLEQ